MFSRFVLLASCVLLAFVSVSAHSRFKCPTARDWNDASGKHIPFDNTGNKRGPCGPYSGQWGMGGVSKLNAKAWQTLTFEESVAHTGAPFRISILDENEVEQIVLLDHVPHNNNSKPVPYVESTYVPYSISVYIPDVLCTKCSIRAIMVMTDKSVACGWNICTYHPDDSECSGHTDSSPPCAGASTNTPCKYANSCFSNYHTCVDVTINGNTPIGSGNFTQPDNWPFAKMTNLQYGDEWGNWQNGWLQGVPSVFNTQAGQTLC